MAKKADETKREEQFYDDLFGELSVEKYREIKVEGDSGEVTGVVNISRNFIFLQCGEDSILGDARLGTKAGFEVEKLLDEMESIEVEDAEVRKAKISKITTFDAERNVNLFILKKQVKRINKEKISDSIIENFNNYKLAKEFVDKVLEVNGFKKTQEEKTEAGKKEN